MKQNLLNVQSWVSSAENVWFLHSDSTSSINSAAGVSITYRREQDKGRLQNTRIYKVLRISGTAYESNRGHKVT